MAHKLTLLTMIPHYKIPLLKVIVKNPVFEIEAHGRIFLTVLQKIMMLKTQRAGSKRG